MKALVLHREALSKKTTYIFPVTAGPRQKQEKQISPPGEILLLLRFDTLASPASHPCTA